MYFYNGIIFVVVIVFLVLFIIINRRKHSIKHIDFLTQKHENVIELFELLKKKKYEMIPHYDEDTMDAITMYKIDFYNKKIKSLYEIINKTHENETIICLYNELAIYIQLRDNTYLEYSLNYQKYLYPKRNGLLKYKNQNSNITRKHDKATQISN